MSQIFKVSNLSCAPQVGQSSNISIFQKVRQIVSQDVVVHIITDLEENTIDLVIQFRSLKLPRVSLSYFVYFQISAVIE